MTQLEYFRRLQIHETLWENLIEYKEQIYLVLTPFIVFIHQLPAALTILFIGVIITEYLWHLRSVWYGGHDSVSLFILTMVLPVVVMSVDNFQFIATLSDYELLGVAVAGLLLQTINYALYNHICEMRHSYIIGFSTLSPDEPQLSTVENSSVDATKIENQTLYNIDGEIFLSIPISDTETFVQVYNNVESFISYYASGHDLPPSVPSRCSKCDTVIKQAPERPRNYMLTQERLFITRIEFQNSAICRSCFKSIADEMIQKEETPIGTEEIVAHNI